ncbi:hypothetical protein NDU88_003665 [Pleurodeles waltl]|uniref:Uncharacterized protein n=1 Tax=Pleurodeles waltl TaxID=8319 RepID=A0AAV7TR90_PLEWA|nr:hypothetical protein NDU88_003665 [Pleurodeles waltl]
MEAARLRTRGKESLAELWLHRLDRGPQRGESSGGGPPVPDRSTLNLTPNDGGTTQRGRDINATVARVPAVPPEAVRVVRNAEYRAEIGGLNRWGPTQGSQ